MREYFKYTLIGIAISIAIKLVVFYTDPLHAQWGKAYMLISPIVTVIMLWPGMVATRNKEFGGFMSGKLATAGGVRIAAISGVFGGLFDYLYYTYINTQALAYHLALNIAGIKREGGTAFELENRIAGAAKFFSPSMQSVFPMFITICAGFFFTVVFAYFIRRYRPGEKSSLQA